MDKDKQFFRELIARVLAESVTPANSILAIAGLLKVMLAKVVIDMETEAEIEWLLGQLKENGTTVKSLFIDLESISRDYLEANS